MKLEFWRKYMIVFVAVAALTVSACEEKQEEQSQTEETTTEETAEAATEEPAAEEVAAEEEAAIPAGGELHIYNWGNYTNPELIAKFEAAHNVKVTLDAYDSNETMLAKVKAGGHGYDIVVPGDYMVAIMIEEGMLEETRPDQMSNFQNVEASWKDVYWDPGRRYSVPWQWGTTSFAVNTAKYSGDINTLAILFDPPEELCGRINMLLDVNDVLNAGLRYLGHPRCNNNPDQLRELNDMLVKAKECWRTMSYDTIALMTAGDVDVTQQWNGAAMRVRLSDVPTASYAYPKEGFTGWMDNVVVLKGAANVENAKLFQNFIMDPENAALISDFAKYANGIAGSETFLDAEFAAAPEIKLPEGAPAPEFVPPCGADVAALYDKIWTNLQK
ncbi:MAG: extracellular solute-binding protein [Rhodospirillaceae bacterium]|nr:extracellular solute-binding protein [Rhodospirillaceae bacterium]